MPIDIIRLLAFEGPNLCAPQPAVLLVARADRDRGARLRAALKDAAQGAGVVIGALEVTTAADGGNFALRASFTTPTPALGAAVARYVVDGLNARERGDAAWDADEELWELQRRRRAGALPLQAVQLLAEAASRGVPAFVQADGALQLGYGASGRAVQVSVAAQGAGNVLAPGDVGVGPPPFARAEASPRIGWEGLGAVPVAAVTGGELVAPVVREVTVRLEARGLRVAGAASAGFAEARVLLADGRADAIVLGLEAGEALTRGLPFTWCAASAVLALPEALPEGATGREELARALGVTMLVTDPRGVTLLDGGTPEVAALAAYAPCRVESVGANAEQVAEALAAAIVTQVG